MEQFLWPDRFLSFDMTQGSLANGRGVRVIWYAAQLLASFSSSVVTVFAVQSLVHASLPSWHVTVFHFQLNDDDRIPALITPQ
jgi:hypothetical protein